MNKYKLSKEMKEEMSVIDLVEFLSKKRKTPLLKYQVKAIKNEIKRKHKRNLKDAEKWTKELMDSPLFHLAITQLIREGKAVKIIESGIEKYYANLPVIFKTISKIIDMTSKNKKRDNLLTYCDAFKSNRK